MSIEELRQVIVVNAELGLPKGKLASQVAHAAVAAFLEATPKARSAWLAAGMPKVVLKASGEAVLQELPCGRLAAGLGLHRLYPLIVRYRWALGQFIPYSPVAVSCGETTRGSAIAQGV